MPIKHKPTLDRLIYFGKRYDATPLRLAVTSLLFVRLFRPAAVDPRGWSLWTPWFHFCKFGADKYIQKNSGHRYAMSNTDSTYRFL